MGAHPYAVWRLGIWNPQDHAEKIDLLLFHWKQFLLHPQSGFRDDTSGIPEMRHCNVFDPLLFGPSDVTRTKYPLDSNGPDDTGRKFTRILRYARVVTPFQIA